MKGGTVMNNDINRLELLKQITVVDFSIIDLHLYLNTHPMDQAAIMQYNSLAADSKMLKEKYENYYGMLTGGTRSPYPWQWINEPWPWEYSANFRLCEEV